jgi:hypothetical protein
MNQRLVAALLNAAAVFHRDPSLKSQLRALSRELRWLDRQPARPAVHETTLRNTSR